jgi:hypothetical protein
MGGGKGGAPPAPDYSAVAAASKEAAELSYSLGKDQLNWAKQQYGSDRELVDKVADSALQTQALNNAAAAKDRARYEQIYQPLENQLVNDAESYASPDRKALEEGKAQATVASQFDQQRKAAQQQLEDYGVAPGAARFSSLNNAMGAAQGAAEAAAGNQSIAQTEAIGRALRSEALNIGKGYPGQVAGTYGTALQAGNQAVNSTLASTASGANTMGTGPQWFAGGNQAVNTWGNTLNMQYQNQLASWKADQEASSGVGALLGTGLGIAAKAFSLADGGAIPNSPSPDNATTGGAIPVSASPSNGASTDDVPARLNAGEFVVPKDVVAWKGEEFLQKLIENSRKAKETAPAKPQMTAVPAGESPHFVSRRVQGALPTG